MRAASSTAPCTCGCWRPPAASSSCSCARRTRTPGPAAWTSAAPATSARATSRWRRRCASARRCVRGAEGAEGVEGAAAERSAGGRGEREGGSEECACCRERLSAQAERGVRVLQSGVACRRFSVAQCAGGTQLGAVCRRQAGHTLHRSLVVARSLRSERARRCAAPGGCRRCICAQCAQVRARSSVRRLLRFPRNELVEGRSPCQASFQAAQAMARSNHRAGTSADGVGLVARLPTLPSYCGSCRA